MRNNSELIDCDAPITCNSFFSFIVCGISIYSFKKKKKRFSALNLAFRARVLNGETFFFLYKTKINYINVSFLQHKNEWVSKLCVYFHLCAVRERFTRLLYDCDCISWPAVSSATFTNLFKRRTRCTHHRK